jgi:hypothetical protein
MALLACGIMKARVATVPHQSVFYQGLGAVCPTSVDFAKALEVLMHGLDSLPAKGYG